MMSNNIFARKRPHPSCIAYEKSIARKAVQEFVDDFDGTKRNETCPCGSNIKYKNCHMKWVDKRRRDLKR